MFIGGSVSTRVNMFSIMGTPYISVFTHDEWDLNFKLNIKEKNIHFNIHV